MFNIQDVTPTNNGFVFGLPKSTEVVAKLRLLADLIESEKAVVTGISNLNEFTSEIFGEATFSVKFCEKADTA